MPGLEFLGIPPGAQIGDILARLYVFGVGLVALSALVMFTLGGVRYMLSGDRDPSEAKAWMRNAFWGLVLALTSWLILYTINPDLVKTLTLQLPGIQQLTPPSTTRDICANPMTPHDIEFCINVKAAKDYCRQNPGDPTCNIPGGGP